MALAIPAFGGSKAVIEPPPPAPTLIQWFVGGSFGMFDVEGSSNYNGSDLIVTDVFDIDLDEAFAFADPDYNGGTGDDTLEDFYNDLTQGDFDPNDLLFDTIAFYDLTLANNLSFRTQISDVDLNMYSLHFGRLVGNAGGFDLAAYLEVAWFTGDFTATGILHNNLANTDLILFREGFDVDIVPITLNLKAERNLFGRVGAYVSGGLGYAFTNVSGSGYDENGGGFYAQAAAGLVWNVTESVDIYGGGRWVHLSDLDFNDKSLGFELDDQLGWEIGARYKF